MKPNSKERSLVTSSEEGSGSFGISAQHAAHIMTILRNTMYTDKTLAVLREYSANAWDAHRVSGKSHIPIKVTLPSELEPTLIIRDFGPGISPDDIFGIYTQYGASTKRDSDVAVGMLGIGSKSGFAYSDTFTVVSYFGGTKSTYVAVLDKTNVGVMQVLDRQPCGEETGIEIQIPVKTKDVSEFIDKAKTLFRYFDPKPDINTAIADSFEVETRFSKAVTFKDGNGWTAVMGCIPYRLNVSQLNAERLSLPVFNFLKQSSGLMFFDIGEVEISASREELNYTDETKKVLEDRFLGLIDEWTTSVLKEIEQSGLTQFERRVRLWGFTVLQYTIPESLKPLMASDVQLTESKNLSFYPIRSEWKKHFGSYVWTLGHKLDYLKITKNSVLVLKDDKRIFRGFKLNEHMIIVENNSKKTFDQLRPELNKILKSMDLEGMPVINLSSIDYEKPTSNRGLYSPNEKHKATGFKLRKDVTTSHVRGSAAWEISNHVPSDSDVFVILEKFRTASYDFYIRYREAERAAKLFKLTMPTIYGYKSTETKPVSEKDVKGVEFNTWLDSWWKTLSDRLPNEPKLVEILEKMGTYNGGRALSNGYQHDVSYWSLEFLKKTLGEKHPVTELLNEYYEAGVSVSRYTDAELIRATKEYVPLFGKIIGRKSDDFVARIKKLHTRYPIFQISDVNLRRLFTGGEAKHWIEYVRAVDQLKGTENDAKTEVHADGRVVDNRVGGAVEGDPQGSNELREAPPSIDLGGLGLDPQVPNSVESTG